MLVKLGQTAKVRKETPRGHVDRQRRRLHGRLFDLDPVFRAGDERIRPSIRVDLGRQPEFRRPQPELAVGIAPRLEGRVDGHADGRIQDRGTLLDRLDRLLDRRHAAGLGLLPLELLDALHQLAHFLLHRPQLLLEFLHRLLSPRRNRNPARQQEHRASENQSFHRRKSHRVSFRQIPNKQVYMLLRTQYQYNGPKKRPVPRRRFWSRKGMIEADHCGASFDSLRRRAESPLPLRGLLLYIWKAPIPGEGARTGRHVCRGQFWGFT